MKLKNTTEILDKLISCSISVIYKIILTEKNSNNNDKWYQMHELTTWVLKSHMQFIHNFVGLP